MLTKSMEKWVYSFLLFTLTFNLFAQENSDNQQQNFSLNSGNIGALQNSINLLSGQVSFPLNLITLPGRSGLDISVSVQYNSSGTDNIIATRNSESPTGILGANWSMDIPKIICDHKGTGSREDDTFYLYEGGTSYKLTCVGGSVYTKEYSTNAFNFWNISYDMTNEKWTITRENGYRYIYGDKNSTANAISWTVKWGNWIGSSANTVGQEQMADGWKLSRIENLWNESLSFTYESVDEAVGAGGKQHTRASYLKKIADGTGQEAIFIYGSKESYEYEDPHIDHTEPDAYQEKYEDKYLQKIKAFGLGGLPLYDVVFEYDLYTFNYNVDTKKRYLKKIIKLFPDGSEQPPMNFSYFQEGEHKGYIESISNSLGARIYYNYEKATIEGADRELTIDPPTGYGKPKVYQQGDYAVVLWYETATNQYNPGVKVQVYDWNGGWSGQELYTFTGTDSSFPPKKYDYQVTTNGEFFAILQKDLKSDSPARLHAFHKKAGAPGEWSSFLYGNQANAFDQGFAPPALVSGDDFIGVGLRENNGTLYTFTWNGTTWVAKQFPFNIERKELYHYTSSGNWIIRHATSNGDYIDLFYLSQDKTWHKRSATSSEVFNSDAEDPSFWYGSPSLAVAMADDNNEFIYSWDEGYNNIKRNQGFAALNDFAKVNITNNALVGIVDTSYNGKIQSARFDGQNWKYTQVFNTSYHGEHGTDLFLHNEFLSGYGGIFGNFAQHLSAFDANTLEWRIKSTGWQKNETISHIIGLEAIGDFFLVGETIYKINKYDDKEYFYQIPLVNEGISKETAFVIAPEYIAYEFYKKDSESISGQGVYLLHVKNGYVIKTEKFDGTLRGKEHFAGPSALAIYNSSGQILLTRMVNQKSSGLLTTTRVKNFIWTDGNQPFETSFSYENGKAVPNGSIALYNKVSVVKGSDDPLVFPYGKTEYFFYNGLKQNELIELPASDNSGKEFLLTGRPYLIRSRNSNAELVAEVKNHYAVYDTLVQYVSGPVDQHFYVRNTKTESLTDSMLNIIEQEYDLATGLIKKVRQYNSSSTNATPDVYETEYTRWWEIYDPITSNNVYAPIAQTTTYKNGNAISSTAITYQYWGGKLGSKATYQWIANGTPDFPGWHGGPVPQEEWKLITTVNKRDDLTGAVLSSVGIDQIPNSIILNNSRTLPIAKAQSANFDEIAYCGFENNNAGNWQFPPSMSSTDSYLGLRSFMAQGGTQSISKTLPIGEYKLQYWWKTDSPQISLSNGAVISSSNEDAGNGWTFTHTELEITSPGTVTLQVPLNGLLDEIRVSPQGSEMITTGYDALGQLKFETDNNLNHTFYEYDGQYRMVTVKDRNNNIVKRYAYHFRNN